MPKYFTPQILEKAKTANSVAELLALAKEHGIELSENEAAEYFSKLNAPSAELCDEELDNVAGGFIRMESRALCEFCGKAMEHGESYSEHLKMYHADKCVSC